MIDKLTTNMSVEPTVRSRSRALPIVGFSFLILLSIVPFGHTIAIHVKPNQQDLLADQVQSPPSGLSVVNVAVNKNPEGVAYDDSNGYVYVTCLGPNQSAPGTVSVMAGTTVVANVTVGVAPLGDVYDSRNRIVYVANYNSGTLSEISGTSVVGNITVGAFPGNLAYDSGNGYLYVIEGNKASMAPNHLIAINGTTIIANVTVGIRASGLAYDPANGNLYVANIGTGADSKGTVLEVDGTSIVANITVGKVPSGVAYDSQNGNIYVADPGNSLSDRGNVSVISGSSIVQTIVAGITPYGIAYNNGDGQIYVSNYGSAGSSGNGFVFSLNGTSVTGNVTVGSVPSELEYDNGNGYIYVANLNSNSVSVLIQTSAVRFDYALQNSGPIVVQPGGNGTVTITATLSSGIIQPITLSCVNPLPPGISCTWIMKGSAGSTQMSVLMIRVAPNTLDENVNFQVTGWPLGATTKSTVISVLVSSGQSSSNILGLDPTLFYAVLGTGLGAAVIAGIIVYWKTRQAKRASKPRPTASTI